jgi:YD repeat-containing protein
VVESTDKQAATTQVSYDPRGLVAEVRVPHNDIGSGIEYRTTRYEYDQVGNRTKVITPRGVATTNTADDFVHESVYDALNRVIEQIHPYDPTDPEFNTPDKTIYAYDKVGNLTSVSAPPSDGQTVRTPPRTTISTTAGSNPRPTRGTSPPPTTTTNSASRPCAP